MKIHFSIKKLFQLCHQGFYVWIRHYKALFLVFFLTVSGLAGYQWYENLYHFSWSEREKKIYIESINKETVFQEKSFLHTLEGLEVVQKQHDTKVEVGRDFFAGVRKKES